jgi:hypothetical protein
MGCYLDTLISDLPKMFFVSFVSIELCINVCLNAGFAFAGLQNG